MDSQMKIQLKKCRTCGALGVGPAAQRLYPLEGQLYCKAHYGRSLDWEVNREAVVMGIEGMVNFIKDAHGHKIYITKRSTTQRWEGYIYEQAGMAGEALVIGDRRTFVYYFSRALWAWELSRGA
jgi:hypothetical protein